jgi:ribosomal protein L30E
MLATRTALGRVHRIAKAMPKLLKKPVNYFKLLIDINIYIYKIIF